ncbi:MAG: hypothetical protein U5J97_03425 [Trueperaceae bacterium]|nr:hypothetical protein [Trueperaceae bacterium]
MDSAWHSQAVTCSAVARHEVVGGSVVRGGEAGTGLIDDKMVATRFMFDRHGETAGHIDAEAGFHDAHLEVIGGEIRSRDDSTELGVVQ